MTGQISSMIQMGILTYQPEIQIVKNIRERGYVISEIEVLTEYTRLSKLLKGA